MTSLKKNLICISQNTNKIAYLIKCLLATYASFSETAYSHSLIIFLCHYFLVGVYYTSFWFIMYVADILSLNFYILNVVIKS